MTAPFSFSELNPEQHAAVSCRPGPVLVSAGPGTGKTRVLVHRVAWLLSQGVPPSSILMLTFTNSAAREMLSRAAKLAGRSAEELFGGTFHSVANFLLCQHGHYIGLRHFSIVDRFDSLELISEVRSLFDVKGLPSAAAILDALSSAASLMLPIQSRLPGCSSDLLRRIAEEYAALKRREGLLDFDDLLAFLLRLLQHEAARSTINFRFDHVLVDEYQDTNCIQDAILRLLAPHGRLYVVGDAAQSIYSFRGAQVGNILHFPSRYSGCSVFALKQNYRSLPPILAFVNAAYPSKDRLLLRTSRSGGTLPVVMHAADEAQEALFVSGEVSSLISSGVDPSDVAVLFRSSHHVARIELELSALGIPYVKRGGIRACDSAHFRDVMAYLRVLSRPKDRIAWTRIFLQLNKVGAKTAARMTDLFLSLDDPFSVSPGQVDASPAVSSAILSLLSFLRRLRLLSDPLQVFRQVVERCSPFWRHYSDFQRRLNDLERLADFVSGFGSLGDLVATSVLDPQQHDSAGVVLSTIHAAKGREWHSVFVVGLAQGLFPDARVDSMDDERRLFYVACTRAKERLFLSWPRRIASMDRTSSCQCSMSSLLRAVHPSLYQTWRAPF